METVTATFGEVVTVPIPYHSFRVGPFSITTVVKPGETHAEALVRAQAVVEAHARAVYAQAKAFWFAEWGVGKGPR